MLRPRLRAFWVKGTYRRLACGTYIACEKAGLCEPLHTNALETRVGIHLPLFSIGYTASQEIAASLDRGYDPIYSEPIAKIWQKGHADLKSISDAELTIFDGLMARQIHNVANMLDARESALIPKARADKMYNQFFTKLFSSLGTKQWILENPDMGEMIDEYVKAIDN